MSNSCGNKIPFELEENIEVDGRPMRQHAMVYALGEILEWVQEASHRFFRWP